ncbi:MAG: type II toxin-antitoxin system PemK/MazF family toxin [candidate division KSB1 bacterium]|nr:type II toxin-antitoxin system PemK/MazF family toxin [candidate division KSB1 bacterium]
MAYKQGEIVLVPFPYSDLSGSKRRPVLIVSNDAYNTSFPDIVVAVITSKATKPDAYSLILESKDLEIGQLPEASLIRVHKLFTIEQSRILRRFSILGTAKLRETLSLLRQLFDHPALHQTQSP